MTPPRPAPPRPSRPRPAAVPEIAPSAVGGRLHPRARLPWQPRDAEGRGRSRGPEAAAAHGGPPPAARCGAVLCGVLPQPEPRRCVEPCCHGVGLPTRVLPWGGGGPLGCSSPLCWLDDRPPLRRLWVGSSGPSGGRWRCGGYLTWGVKGHPWREPPCVLRQPGSMEVAMATNWLRSLSRCHGNWIRCHLSSLFHDALRMVVAILPAPLWAGVVGWLCCAGAPTALVAP